MLLLLDINECHTGNGGCEQSCNNTIGSFYCSCDTGYQLENNGLNCSGENFKMIELHLASFPGPLKKSGPGNDANLHAVVHRYMVAAIQEPSL